MTNRWPAVDISSATDPELTLARVDDFAPTAVEERLDSLRVFFTTARDRDDALAALAASGHVVHPVDVDDEDWARRSQQHLAPVTVGRVVVVSHQSTVGSHQSEVDGPEPATSYQLPATSSQPPATRPQPPVTIVIQPSMGFGTGHHASTRLCLAALQSLDLAGCGVLDVGTGSGILAIASVRLGASYAVGVDVDADAVQSASENLSLNPEAEHVTFGVADFRTASLDVADMITANLTGALLGRSAGRLKALVRPGGTVVLSGVLAEERDAVVSAFEAISPISIVGERVEDGWVGLTLKIW